MPGWKTWPRLVSLMGDDDLTPCNTHAGHHIIHFFSVSRMSPPMYTLLYLKWITWGSMEKCLGVAKSLQSSPEAITTLLIGYTPIRNGFGVIKWITNKDLLFSTWNSVQCYKAAWMGGESGGEWVCVHTYGWVPLLFSWNYHNAVNRLYPKIKWKVKKKKSESTINNQSICTHVDSMWRPNLSRPI